MTNIDLKRIVNDFARCIELADSRRPQAVNARSKEPYLPGIGPHPESQTVKLVTDEMMFEYPDIYGSSIHLGVNYPKLSRQKCDLCIGEESRFDWGIEIKMLRILGDNGKPNDNILMHILSPYPKHRSALTDCGKLLTSNIAARLAIIIYGYEAEDYPLELAIEAFEHIASMRVQLGQRLGTQFGCLIHPVHRDGAVFGWEILGQL